MVIKPHAGKFNPYPFKELIKAIISPRLIDTNKNNFDTIETLILTLNGKFVKLTNVIREKFKFNGRLTKFNKINETM